MHKDPQRTMKYTQHTLQQTVEIRSFMKRHLHLRRNPPHPFPPLYLQNGGNFGILHCWDGRKGNNPSRWTSSWKNITVSLTPVLGWIGSDVSDLGHPKMLPPPSAQGLADGAVFSFTWKVAKCPWPGSRNAVRTTRTETHGSSYCLKSLSICHESYLFY